MPFMIGFVSAIASFLVKYFSFRVVKITLSIFFNSIAVAFIFTAFYFGLNILIQVWDLFNSYMDQANSIGNVSSFAGVAVAFLDASGLLAALRNVFDLGFLVLSLIFAKAAYQLGKSVHLVISQMIHNSLKLI